MKWYDKATGIILGTIQGAVVLSFMAALIVRECLSRLRNKGYDHDKY